jgi:hypothetical protein
MKSYIVLFLSLAACGGGVVGSYDGLAEPDVVVPPIVQDAAAPAPRDAGAADAMSDAACSATDAYEFFGACPSTQPFQVSCAADASLEAGCTPWNSFAGTNFYCCAIPMPIPPTPLCAMTVTEARGACDIELDCLPSGEIWSVTCAVHDSPENLPLSECACRHGSSVETTTIDAGVGKGCVEAYAACGFPSGYVGP